MIVAVSGATFVRADRIVVWAALHDVDVVARCIPGCRSLIRSSDRVYELLLKLRFGPIRLAFEGTVEETESDAPRRYCLVGRGRGSGAGEAVGKVTITLVEQAGGCRLSYEVEAEMRGPITTAGSRVLSRIGKAIAIYFAARFGELVGERRPKAPAATLQRI